jgi:phage I-like protein
MLRLTALDGDAPPTEFRLFAYGVNATTHGPVLFDEQAARDVMAAYERHGVDLMIDLGHQSIADGPTARADAGDARGWFKLELRADGLYAYDVRWTPDGERRLREKTQRYISPVVVRDKKTSRAVEIWNVALCAMPAMVGAVPLVAASKLTARERAACYLERVKNGSR